MLVSTGLTGRDGKKRISPVPGTLRQLIVRGKSSDLGKEFQRLEQDIEDFLILTLEKTIGEETPYHTVSELKKALDLRYENRVVNAVELFAFISHWVAFMQMAPLIKVTPSGERFLEWISLDEARATVEKHLAERYNFEKILGRLKEEDVETEIKLKPSEAIEEVLRKWKEQTRKPE